MDLQETFPQLAKDPIVEAMISLVARVEGDWSESSAGQLVASVRDKYPQSQSLNSAQITLAFQPGQPSETGDTTLSPASQQAKIGWAGYRVFSADSKQAATITRDGITVNCLAPYRGWQAIYSDALWLWERFAKCASIRSVERLLVRYINRLEVPEIGFEPSKYFEGIGSLSSAMIRGPFLHQDVLALREMPSYQARLVRTIDLGVIRPGIIPLIVDIEAVMTEPFPAEMPMISKRLEEMHWLKNTAFFAGVTKGFTDLCR